MFPQVVLENVGLEKQRKRLGFYIETFLIASVESIMYIYSTFSNIK